MGALFGLLNRYAALSQTRIGTAADLTQGRVGEVMKGTRRVSGLRVFQRIADGFDMPDDCRLLLGVSPRSESPASQLTEIALRQDALKELENKSLAEQLRRVFLAGRSCCSYSACSRTR